jgi:hypothetical protein
VKWLHDSKSLSIIVKGNQDSRGVMPTNASPVKEEIMLRINYLALIVAGVAGFVAGSLWYSPLLFGKLCVALHGMDTGTLAGMKIPAGEVLSQFIRGLAVVMCSRAFSYFLGS